MTQAEQITKDWTKLYTEDQFERCVQQCVSRIDGSETYLCYIQLTFKDGSSILLWEDSRWEVIV